jgi:hypothetical protein
VREWGIQYDDNRWDQPAWQRYDYGKKHGHQHKHKHRADYPYTDNCPDPDSPDAYDCD